MRRFALPPVDLAICNFRARPTEWQLGELADLDSQLKACKSRMDEPYRKDAREFERMTMDMEPSRAIRARLATQFAPQLPTNAWLKLIEILAEFGIVARTRRAGRIRMFDNASAPGAFIFAAQYWTSTIEKVGLEWMASTLLATKDNTALGDTYGLALNYPDHFATDGTRYNGDTCDVKYLRHVESNFGGHFDLYTSDLGMFVPADAYNYQEAINARGNLGQILMGLLVLRPGGALITKQFTHMSSFTVSLMAILAGCFAEVHVVKPIASKADNSEEYIVALNYVGVPGHVRDLMFAALEQPWDIDIRAREFAPPLIPSECVGAPFMTALAGLTRELVAAQCQKIDANLAEFYKMKETARIHPSPEFTRKYVLAATNEWFHGKRLKKMNPRHFLSTTTNKTSGK